MSYMINQFDHIVTATEQVGLVIGSGGETLQKLQDETGASVRVPTKYSYSAVDCKSLVFEIALPRIRVSFAALLRENAS